MWALVALAVGLSPRRHGRACPGYPRRQRFAGNASKTGPTWGAARSKVLQAQSFRPCRAHEHSMRPTTWIAGTSPAMTPSSSSGDPLITPIPTTNSERDKSHNVRARSEAMVYLSGQPIPSGWRWWPAPGDGVRTQAAAAQDGPAQFRGSDHPGRDTKWP
jgi:hypothetical protein